MRDGTLMEGKSGNNAVETYSLSKSYGNIQALNSVEAKIPKGAVGLLGPNGAGKSTLIKTVLGLARPTSGSFSILNEPSGTGRATIRQKVGYVPEADCLIPDLDALAYVRYMGELSGLPPMDAMQRAHEVLHYVGIGEERYRPIKTYSTGMQQKVKLAQALVHDPELVILDEPTNGMDPKGRQEMLDLVRDITRTHGKAIILSTHLLPDVEYVCDHVLIMDQGNIVLQGGLKELTSQVDHYDIRIKGDDKVFSKVLSDLGFKFDKSGSFFKVRTDRDVLPVLYPALKGTGIQVRHASRTGLTLEDLFMMKVKGGGTG